MALGEGILAARPTGITVETMVVARAVVATAVATAARRFVKDWVTVSGSSVLAFVLVLELCWVVVKVFFSIQNSY